MSNSTWHRMAIVAVTLLLTGLLGPRASLPHPLGNFSISHYTALSIQQDTIELRYVLDLAEIPTFQEIQEHGIVPEVDQPRVQAYVAQKAAALQDGLFLEVNSQRLTLHNEMREVLFPPGAGGLPTLKLGLRYRASLTGVLAPGPNRLFYQDANFAGRAGWKEIIAVAGPGVALVHSSVPTTDRSRQLSDYPTDLLNSPPQVLQAQVLFIQEGQSEVVAMGGANASSTPGAHRQAGVAKPQDNAASWLQANAQATPRNAFTELISAHQLSLGIVLLAVVVAVGLGAFHALEPGHGKTVVAAYLVGSQGTAWHALWLGLIVTATHTAGVYLLGAVTLYASRYMVPERLYPWLGVASGVIIAGLGLYLFLQRYAGKDHAHTHGHGHAHGHTHEHTHEHTPTHGHPHSHGHLHAHGQTHAHGSHQHHHHEPGEAVTFRQLLALGVTGGIVPCPAALVVLLSAVALRRVGFGLLLIVAFSVGLAAVLIAIGLFMVYARRFMSRFQGEGPLITRWLPLTSAGLITVFGMAMVVQALVTAGVLTIRL
jgi:nickel/cobalt exporter